MLNHDDEMVVDDEMCMGKPDTIGSSISGSAYVHPSFNDASLIDPALLTNTPASDTIPYPALLIHTPAPDPISSPTTEQSFPVEEFYQYRHAGCLCKVKLEHFPDTVLEVFEPVKVADKPADGPTTIWLSFPLNCKYCTWSQKQGIKVTSKRRRATIKKGKASKEIRDRLRAYEKGIRDGRIEALSLPLSLSTSAGTAQGGELATGIAKLMAGVEGINLAKADVGDELAVCMQQVSLEYCELTYDFERLFELQDLREKGRLDGLGIQARKDIKMLKNKVY